MQIGAFTPLWTLFLPLKQGVAAKDPIENYPNSKGPKLKDPM